MAVQKSKAKKKSSTKPTRVLVRFNTGTRSHKSAKDYSRKWDGGNENY